MSCDPYVMSSSSCCSSPQAVLVDTADEVFRNTVWESGVTGYGLQVGNVSYQYCRCSESEW